MIKNAERVIQSLAEISAEMEKPERLWCDSLPSHARAPRGHAHSTRPLAVMPAPKQGSSHRRPDLNQLTLLTKGKFPRYKYGSRCVTNRPAILLLPFMGSRENRAKCHVKDGYYFRRKSRGSQQHMHRSFDCLEFRTLGAVGGS